MDEYSLRAQIVEYGKRLVETGLVQGTWGNISVRLDDSRMLVTPSGLDYMSLTPEDIVLVDIRTLEYNSTRKPTSEKKIHAAVYLSKPDANAVIHAHSSLSSVFAAARVALPACTDAMKKYVGGDARCAPHALPSTGKLTKVSIKALEGRNGCLLAGHGVLCCGDSLETAFETCRVMEEAAAVALA